MCLSGAVEGVYRELRGSVQLKIRRVGVDEPRKPQVLDNKRVRTRFIQEFRILKSILKLTVPSKYVERDIGLYAPRTAIRNGLRHLVFRKALRPSSGVEYPEPHIYSTRSGLYSGPYALW